MQNRLAILFPGIGYNIDKPLLHYARRVVTEAGYDVLIMPYTSEAFENGHVTGEGVNRAYQICQEALVKQDLSSYREILLIGKSVGTLLSGMCLSDIEKESNAEISLFVLTPLRSTFPYLKGRSMLAFAGTKDPVIEERVLRMLAEQNNISLALYKDANHSLEVRNNPNRSVEILGEIVRQLQMFIHIKTN